MYTTLHNTETTNCYTLPTWVETIRQRFPDLVIVMTGFAKDDYLTIIGPLFKGKAFRKLDYHLGYEESEDSEDEEDEQRIRDLWFGSNYHIDVMVEADVFKIHLMPKPEQPLDLVLELMSLIQSRPDLQMAIKSFKVQKNAGIFHDRDGQPLPKVVIYIGAKLGDWTVSARNAQLVLDAMYAQFGSVEGLDVTPRYNQRITSLIYIAQGNGDFKRLQKKVWTDDMVYLRPDAMAGRTYHILRNPADPQATVDQIIRYKELYPGTELRRSCH